MNNNVRVHSIAIQKDLLDKLNRKKNLMVYDGFKDNLEDNIEVKYFYSNPYDPLEFINLDIFNKPVILPLGKDKHKVYGRIYIYRERINLKSTNHNTEYGILQVEDVSIRDIAKSKITIFINHLGIGDLGNLIDYFELNYCSKSCSSVE